MINRQDKVGCVGQRGPSVRRVQATPPGAASVFQYGHSLVELLLAMLIGSILLLSLQGVMMRGLQAQASVQSGNSLSQQAHFAMQQMVRAVGRSESMLLPSPENPNTAWPESVREFPPRVAFPNESAVLAVLLDPAIDLDLDGFPDADNDGDGKFNEDPGGDSSNDLLPGLFGIDDDNDGSVDEQHTQVWNGNLGPLNEDDDEDDYANEDLHDGLDEDGDGKLDEDIKKQTDGNGLSGAGGVDDNGNGVIDEGDKNDDDEDGSIDEDWYDYVVFYLDSGSLKQRTPVPWDENLDSIQNGTDVIVSTLADNVSRFRVERLAPGNSGVTLLDLVLELTDPVSGESASMTTRVRVGGAL